MFVRFTLFVRLSMKTNFYFTVESGAIKVYWDVKERCALSVLNYCSGGLAVFKSDLTD